MISIFKGLLAIALSFSVTVGVLGGFVALTEQHRNAHFTDTVTRLQNTSVFVSTGGASCGTGILIYQAGVNYVLTAAHVVRANRTENSITDPTTGNVTRQFLYGSAVVIKGQYVDGSLKDSNVTEGDIVSYSEAQDLALIKLRKVISTNSVVFKRKGVRVGDSVMYVGTYMGNPRVVVSTGILSVVDYMIFGHTYNLSTTTAFPGASGGGVYDRRSGECVGVLSRAMGETFNASTPVSRIEAWAARQGCLFVVDAAAKDTPIVMEDRELNDK